MDSKLELNKFVSKFNKIARLHMEILLEDQCLKFAMAFNSGEVQS